MIELGSWSNSTTLISWLYHLVKQSLMFGRIFGQRDDHNEIDFCSSINHTAFALSTTLMTTNRMNLADLFLNIGQSIEIMSNTRTQNCR